MTVTKGNRAEIVAYNHGIPISSISAGQSIISKEEFQDAVFYQVLLKRVIFFVILFFNHYI
jgi:hypothetical protein